MSREIKFRAWDSQNNEWLLGYNYKNLGGFSMYGEMMLMEEWNAAVHAHNRAKIYINLMQFTGLKDSHGKEIYEGDIVEVNSTYHDFGKASISWVESEVRFAAVLVKDKSEYMIDGDLDKLTVIGNIYENPELLEAQTL